LGYLLIIILAFVFNVSIFKLEYGIMLKKMFPGFFDGKIMQGLDFSIRLNEKELMYHRRKIPIANIITAELVSFLDRGGGLAIVHRRRVGPEMTEGKVLQFIREDETSNVAELYEHIQQLRDRPIKHYPVQYDYFEWKKKILK